MHAKSGNNCEVMGLMQGKVKGGMQLIILFEFILDTIFIMDVFGLPVQGTETRVNAGHDANEFMLNHMNACEQVNRMENICGWYHSHPGYGCWLGGIDVATQSLY